MILDCEHGFSDVNNTLFALLPEEKSAIDICLLPGLLGARGTWRGDETAS